MKITNWCKKLSAALLAAGILAPCSVYAATNIPLGDPSFDDFSVIPYPTLGYAYSDTYRPTSDWVDDLNNPPGYNEDDGVSAWLYDADYADANGRAAPRTGNQAMHGLFNYSAQVTGAVFEANHTYTFSIWAQNDISLNDTNGLFMYIFDGSVAFSDAASLASSLTTAINQRTSTMTRAESQANWTLLSLSHYVEADAPEIGNPVGVGFFARRDTAIDDASLSVVPEPTSVFLVGLGLGGAALLAQRRRD